MRSVFRSIMLFLPSVAILAAAQTYSTDVQNEVMDRERQLKQTVENENRDIVCNFNFGPLHLLAKTSKWTPKKVNKYIFYLKI